MNRRITLHNDTGELPRLMNFVEEFAHDAKIANDMTMSLQLALEEAVVNVMHYAYPASVSGDIEVGMEYDGHNVVFVIEDCGKEFDPTSVADADIGLDAEEREIGGLGIFITRQIMDTMEYCRRGERNILRLTKIINT